MSKLVITEIEGVRYATVPDASRFTGKTVTHLRWLIQHGNSVRKMRAKRYGTHYFIPEEEIYSFPFVKQGSHKYIYNYNKEGELVLRTSDKSD